ncbi:MAG: RDD family protein [Rhodocyclaceae bacterium]|nr:RDD family protein [Rhodocyclaceae bacterium]MBK6907692.1 RDD family protein [Rhodocyclaceae bacterium]
MPKPYHDSGNPRALPSIRRRLAAMLYESLLLLGVLSLSFMVPHLILGVIFQISAPGVVLLLHVALVLGIYFVWYWTHGGQTLAMQTWKLKLTTPDGRVPTLRFLVLRYLLAWPSLLFYGAGIVWAVFDRDRQFLHDRLSGTRIVFTHTGQPI